MDPTCPIKRKKLRKRRREKRKSKEKKGKFEGMESNWKRRRKPFLPFFFSITVAADKLTR